MPWLWPDFLFALFPEGRAHSRYLKIVQGFTQKVIQDRAQGFQANEIRGKRSAFLGFFIQKFP